MSQIAPYYAIFHEGTQPFSVEQGAVLFLGAIKTGIYCGHQALMLKTYHGLAL
jgi:hypothetical protein